MGVPSGTQLGPSCPQYTEGRGEGLRGPAGLSLEEWEVLEAAVLAFGEQEWGWES